VVTCRTVRGWEEQAYLLFFIFILYFQQIATSLIGIAMIVFKGRDKAAAFPFGPYLAIAGWITLIWGDELMGVYLTSF